MNEIACAAALLGMSFAVIWIMMAKGSKAWYEVYERYIFEIEREETDGLKIPERYRLGALCRPWEMNSNLFSKKAGRYSPSRLNITIGTVLMTAWFVIFLLHYIASIVLLHRRNGPLLPAGDSRTHSGRFPRHRPLGAVQQVGTQPIADGNHLIHNT